MTTQTAGRTLRSVAVPGEAVDFTSYTNRQAQRRVCELAAAGLADENIAVMVGWPRDLVRRALDPNSASKGTTE